MSVQSRGMESATSLSNQIKKGNVLCKNSSSFFLSVSFQLDLAWIRSDSFEIKLN